jgi:hypothetical protein
MKKSATDLMQEILFSAVIDAIDAMKARAGGVPNNLLRDLNALHANTAYTDLPPELQAAIGASTRAAFAKLLKEGYSVAPAQAAPPRQAPAEGVRVDRRERRAPPRHGDAPGPRGPRRGPGGPGGPGRPGGGGGPRSGGGGRGGPGGGRGGPSAK